MSTIVTAMNDFPTGIMSHTTNTSHSVVPASMTLTPPHTTTTTSTTTTTAPASTLSEFAGYMYPVSEPSGCHGRADWCYGEGQYGVYVSVPTTMMTVTVTVPAETSAAAAVETSAAAVEKHEKDGKKHEKERKKHGKDAEKHEKDGEQLEARADEMNVELKTHMMKEKNEELEKRGKVRLNKFWPW